MEKRKKSLFHRNYWGVFGIAFLLMPFSAVAENELNNSISINFVGCSDEGADAAVLLDGNSISTIEIQNIGSSRNSQFVISVIEKNPVSILLTHQYSDGSKIVLQSKLRKKADQIGLKGMLLMDYPDVFTNDLNAVWSFFEMINAVPISELQDGYMINCQ